VKKKDVQISIIGSGNVATHLGKALYKKGYTILQVYSRSNENANLLAEQIEAEAISDIEKINPKADLFLLAINDSALPEIISKFPKVNGVVAHTAGSVPISVFENYFENYGVFYPLQTFSKHIKTKLKKVPFCIEANNSENEQFLSDIASSLSKNVKLIDSHQRETLHLAAVFVCNFSNYIYVIGDELLEKNNLDFELLKPLIKKTTKKLQSEKHPINLQTGPAIRGDDSTINKHINILKDKPSFQKLYLLFSKMISAKG